MVPRILMAVSAAIIGLLGLAHLYLTFSGPQLLPRDRSLKDAMGQVSPVLTTHTTIWKMWIGFNASHSMGAILFGLSYGYLALAHGDLLFQSVFLQVLGLAMLAGFVVLAKVYWFSAPLVGCTLSLILYLISVGVAWAA
jgi:hypothetical protein